MAIAKPFSSETRRAGALIAFVMFPFLVGAAQQLPLPDWRLEITKPLTGAAPLAPGDYFSDLDEEVHFTDENIISWRPPPGWAYRNEIKPKGFLTFFPEKGSLQALYFKNTVIKMGQLKWNDISWADTNSVRLFSGVSGVPVQDLVILGKRDLTTQGGHFPAQAVYTARVFYFAKASAPYGAVATITHKGFVHYYIIFGKDVAEKHGVHNAFGTFHRLVYRYTFTLKKDIRF